MDINKICACGGKKLSASLRCKKCHASPIPRQDTGNLCKCGGVKYKYSYKCYKCFQSSGLNPSVLCDCGEVKCEKSLKCRRCNNKSEKILSRKVTRPDKEKLELLIWEKPMETIGKEFGVSGNAVKKWCKYYGIESFPGRGYWMKKKVQPVGNDPTFSAPITINSLEN